MPTTNFEDDRHALVCGILWGTLLKHGIQAVPIGDDEGNYTPLFRILIPVEVDDDEAEKPPVQVVIQVISTDD